MRFSDSDIRPNSNMPLASVRVGATSDARWRWIEPTEDASVGPVSSVRVHEDTRRCDHIYATPQP